MIPSKREEMMKRRFVKKILCAVPAVAIALSFAYALPVLTDSSVAFSQQRQVPERPKRQTPAMSQENYKLLQEAQELVDQGQTREAMERVNKLLGRRGINAYEEAMAYNYLGFLYYELGNTQRAIQEYERVIGNENVPYRFEDAVRYTLAQIYSIDGQFNKALSMLDEWFRYQADPRLSAYQLKGQIYYQMGQAYEEQGNKARALEAFRLGMEPLEYAINQAKATDAPIRENWYQLLAALAYALGDIEKAKDTLEIMIVRWPRPQYWVQLAGMYSELEQYERQLAVMDVAYRLGFVEREQNLKNVAQLYNFNGVPYLAAKVMEEGFNTTNDEGEAAIDPTDPDNQELYGLALLNAKEYEEATEPLEKAAAEADDGDLYLQLGHVYSTLEDWRKAANAMDNAIRKGVDRPDQAYLYLGQAYFNMENFNRAEEAFREARKNQNSRRNADNWLGYIRAERQRVRRLADAGLR